ncbi:MAG: transposase, partial [Myxococcales bacterium]
MEALTWREVAACWVAWLASSLARCVRVVAARIRTVWSSWLTGEEGSNRVGFSKGFKAQAVRRMLEGKSATALAKEMEVSQSTLSRWLREALK